MKRFLLASVLFFCAVANAQVSDETPPAPSRSAYVSLEKLREFVGAPPQRFEPLSRLEIARKLLQMRRAARFALLFRDDQDAQIWRLVIENLEKEFLNEILQLTGESRKQFGDVPFDSWIFPAFETLYSAGFSHEPSIAPNGKFIKNRPITRYELAIFLARLSDQKLDARFPLDAQKGDILAALCAEFDFELWRLSKRDSFSLGLRARKNSTPPRLTLPPQKLEPSGVTDFLPQTKVQDNPR